MTTIDPEALPLDLSTRNYAVTAMRTLEQVYNARDVDRVVRCFSAEAVIQDDAGTVYAQGEEAIRVHFGGFLTHGPDLHSEILSRIQVGTWVVQEEHTTGLVLEEPVPGFHVAVAYRVEEGKIVKSIGLL